MKNQHQLVPVADLSGSASGEAPSRVVPTGGDHENKSDQQLLEEIRDDSADSLELLMDRYDDFAYSLVVHFARGSLQESAWFDIVQIVWIKIWKWTKKSKNLRDCNFGGFLRTCVHHETVSALRRLNANRQRAVQLPDDFDMTVPDPRSDPFTLDTVDDVEFLLKGVDARLATIIRSYYFDGKTLSEISELPTVKLTTGQISKLLNKWLDKTRDRYRNGNEGLR